MTGAARAIHDTVPLDRPSGALRRLLVVEDHNDHLELIRVLLRRAPWTVVAASTLAETLERLADSSIEAVLLDLNLPDSRGLATLEAVVAQVPDVPVVVATVVDDESLGVDAVHRGAQDYLVKGTFDAGTLTRTLRFAVERRQAELATARLAAVVMASDDAIVATSVDGLVTAWNGGAERLYRCPAVEALGTPAARFVPSDRQAEIAEAARRLRAGHHLEPFETVRQRLDGTLVEVALSLSAVRDRRGRLIGLSSIARDITARRRAEGVLQESQRRLQAIVESEPECVALVALDGTVLEMNPAGLALLEAEGPEDVVGRDLLDFVQPDDAGEVAAMRDAVGRGARMRVTFRVLGRGGRQRWVDSACVPLRDAGGDIDCVLTVSTDVTAQREAEAALRESEERYRALFEEHPQPLWVFDRRSLQILAANRTAASHYGYTLPELLALRAPDLRAQPDPALLQADLVALEQEGRFHGLRRHRRKDGSEIDVEVSWHPIEFGGVPAAMAVANDVTERRRLEEQLLQAQKMDAVGRLAGGVAHDFNNLLGVIIGHAELLRRELPAEGSPHSRVRDVLAAADRAAELTQQLLAFSRKQVLQPRVIDLNAVVRETEGMLRRLIGEDVRLVTLLDERLGRVRADPGQVGQIIMNLAVNARDAMPQGGRLLLETTNVTIGGESTAYAGVAAGPYVLLAVSDTGVGMTAEVRARIFEPFFTTKPTGRGTGLGLATVYGIVKQSGGHVGVYSEPGHGSTFRVYLPRVDGLPDTARAEVPAPRGGTESVLLVEDDAALRQIAREVLAGAGYRVSAAADAEQALGQLAEATPDVLVSDIVLPGVTGRELADRVRAIRPDVRVLFISGYTAGFVGASGELEGDADLLPKPFTPDALLRKLREVLERQ